VGQILLGSSSTKHISEINLTKSDISNAVYLEIGLSKSECADLVNSVFNHLSGTMGRGETVKLANFGVFRVSEKNERPGRNPKTGEPVVIRKRKVVTFKPSTHFNSRVNGALKKTPSKDYGSKEELLRLLSSRLQCDVDDVGFLFGTSDQHALEDEIEIPNRRSY